MRSRDAAGPRRPKRIWTRRATTSTGSGSVIHEGERVYCVDEFACETFEDYAYSSYARLNEERQGILQDVLRRGSVYG